MSKRRAFVRGLILFALAFTNLNDIWSPDVLPNALFAWTAIRERNVDYDEFVFRPNQPSSPGRLDSEAYFFRACGVSTATQPPKAPRSMGGPPAPGPNDHVCSVFPPGMAILALPFFAPLVIAGFDPLDLGLLVRMGHVVGALVEVLATLVLWSCVRRFVGPRWSLVLVLLYFFGTSVRTIASQALWQHSGVHLAVALALSVVLREESVGYGRELVAGLALGLGTVVRQTTALVALGIGGLSPRRLLAGLAGAAIGAALLFAALAWGIGTGMLRTVVTRALFGVLAAWSFLLFNAAALVYDQSWDTVPVNVNVDPSKLFSWSDPQWLAVLRMVPDGGPKVIAAVILSLLLIVLLIRIELRAAGDSVAA